MKKRPPREKPASLFLTACIAPLHARYVSTTRRVHSLINGGPDIHRAYDAGDASFTSSHNFLASSQRRS